jgi:hypothetical protein
MKVPAVLHASFAVLIMAAVPAEAQFGDLLKKAQGTIEEVTGSSLGSVSSDDAGSVESQQSSGAAESSVRESGTLTLGNYPTSNNTSRPGSPEDIGRYDIKGFSADMTAAEFKSLVVKLGGTLQDQTRDIRNAATVLWAENLGLTVGGFTVEKIVFKSHKSNSYRYPGTWSRKGPFNGLNQEVTVDLDGVMSQLEMEKVWEALDRKFVGRQNRDNWWSRYEATDPDTGDIAALQAQARVHAGGFNMEYTYLEMLPPVEIESDDF